MDRSEDALARARRRFEADRSLGQEELERAQAEFDQAGRSLVDLLVDWTARGSEVQLELRDGQRITGLLITIASDHVVVDDEGRGEVIVRTVAIGAAIEVGGGTPRRPTIDDGTIVAALRSAIAFARPITVWRSDIARCVEPLAVAGDHLLGRDGPAEIAWRLDNVDVISIDSRSPGA